MQNRFENVFNPFQWVKNLQNQKNPGSSLHREYYHTLWFLGFISHTAPPGFTEVIVFLDVDENGSTELFIQYSVSLKYYIVGRLLVKKKLVLSIQLCF